MTFKRLIQTRIMGRLVIVRKDDAVRLEGHFPNPEIGMRYYSCVAIFALLIIVSAPALYYGAPNPPPQSLGELAHAIITGIPAALVPLVELARTWVPGEPPPDLNGWGFALGMAFMLLMFGAGTASVWRDLTDSPYLVVKRRDDTLIIASGLHRAPVTIPWDECRAVHVARRRSGYYEVLLQHAGTLTPVAIVIGGERRALLLKAKIDEMLASDAETGLS